MTPLTVESAREVWHQVMADRTAHEDTCIECRPAYVPTMDRRRCPDGDRLARADEAAHRIYSSARFEALGAREADDGPTG